MSLEEKSLFQTTINYWNQLRIKSKLGNFFTSHQQPEIFSIRELLKHLVNDLLREIEDSNKIPDQIKAELFYLLRPIGSNLVQFLLEIKNRLGDPENSYPTVNNYIDLVQWTELGTIDKVKTFTMICNEKSTAYKKINNGFLIMEACRYCLEGKIESIWNECSREDKKTLSQVVSDNEIATYWKWHFEDKGKFIFQQNSKKEDEDFGRELMARRAILASGNNSVAVKYFFEKLVGPEEEEEEEARSDLAESLIEEEEINSPGCDLIIHAIQQMTEKAKLRFFNSDRSDIILKIINTWPWRQLVPEILELSFQDLEMEQFYLGRLLEIILQRNVEEYEFTLRLFCTSFWMIDQFLDEYPSEKVFELCLGSMRMDARIKVKALSLIFLRREEIFSGECREKMVQQFWQCCEALVREGTFELLDIFMEKVLTDGEKKDFLNDLDLLSVCKTRIIQDDVYNEIEKLLDWRFKKQLTEKVEFKRKFREGNVWREIVQSIYGATALSGSNFQDKITRFITWVNFTKEQIRELKSYSKNIHKNHVTSFAKAYKGIKKCFNV